MQIIGSNIELSSAHRFEARYSLRERLKVAVHPGQDSFAHGAKGDRDVDKLIKLLQRYLDGRPGKGNNEQIADKIDRLVKRIEQRQGDEGEVQFDLKYRRQESYREVEATSFRATGSVATADGRQIDFTAALDLARVYARTETISLRASGTIDPAAAAAADPAPAPTLALAPAPASAPAASQPALSLGGSVLGLDANGDGQVDVATELVGQSGNGFAELAKFDEDGNGFIDAGDSIFSKLALVDQGPNGLTADTLAVRGVGAIYTGSVSTPYRYTDGSNQTVANLSRSGIYLNENGTTGIAQQVDVLI